MVVEWAGKVRETPGAATMLINSGKLWLCQLLLVFTYPPYFYIFTTLSKGGKTAFALLLPIIKIFMKNILARTVTHLRDEMPEVVVFNCDVFNSLFVSYCMQNSPSIWITLEIMAFDVVMMAFSLRDATSSRKYLKSLEQKIAHQRSLSQKLTTLQRVSILLSDGSKPNNTLVSPTTSPTRIAPSPVLVTGLVGSNRIPSTVVVKPKTIENVFAPAHNSSPVTPVQRAPILEQVVGGSPRLQSNYIRKVQRLVYAAEFLLLLNYVEVIIPLLFSIYLIGMYHLPNGNYYAQIHRMDQTELVDTLRSVQFYCSLQLVSLLLLFVALQQMLGLSPVHQLAFVLEKQFDGVQIKLVFWVFYNVQASLQHNGYDYKFKFPWLHPTQ
ncbi:hypothetical protein PF010_g23672 [Phytophthora fragariae]|uniref:Uncharacterized protein n=1 Tax=Phytophthora fragariae TaxID=53985 RepID=A0A6G0K5S1_9STRA|nr:hypothetical protein PF010_g23672 [Phytophthora fragariae]